MIRIAPGLRRGTMSVPLSKSHAHRVLMAEFLADSANGFREAAKSAEWCNIDSVCDDIMATRRCLDQLRDALAGGHADAEVELDCGESGTTRRLLGPIVSALGVAPRWLLRGRLADRPQIDYPKLCSGLHEISGDVSSQFVSGLLLALPILTGDSEIRLTTPLASRGYVDMTIDVLRTCGISVFESETGFQIPGSQRYVLPEGGIAIEPDWSGAAFPLAMNALGSEIRIEGFDTTQNASSRQPDRVVVDLLGRMAEDRSEPLVIDVDACPDLFPVLTVVSACRRGRTRFVGIGRLRFKESDRVAAMEDVLRRFGAGVAVDGESFTVTGTGHKLRGGSFSSFADHRVAMSVAVGATRSDSPVELDDEACSAKSYPGFFAAFGNLEFLKTSI